MKTSITIKLILITVLLFVVHTFAVTGRVVDAAGAPISGVTVTLIHNTTSTTTKSDGTFSLQSSTSSVVDAKTKHPSTITQFMKNGRVSISMPYSGNLEIKAYNLHGKVIGEFQGFVEQGTHNVPILSESPRAELVILRVTRNSLRALKRMNSFFAIDTLRLSKNGFATFYTHIDSMTENMGTIILSPSQLPATDFYRINFLDAGHVNFPHIVEGQIQVTDSKRVGVTGLENCLVENLCEFRVDNVPVDDISLLSVTPFWKPYASEIRLVIDRGNALSVTAFDSVRAAVKDFVRAQTGTIFYRVFTFGTVVETLVELSTDTTEIFAAIDGLVRKGNTNNLFGALYTALTAYPSSIGEGGKPLVVVAFTDGLDDEGAYDIYDVSNANNNKQIWIVAGTWNLFSTESFKGFADDRVYPAATLADLRTAFRSIHAAHRIYESSFYRVIYKSPQRDDANHKLAMRILTNTNTGTDARDTITFNSKDFVDGSAPALKSVAINAVPNRGLRVSYEYTDADGDPEGDSKMFWYKSTKIGEWQQVYFTIDDPDSVEIDTTNNISYRVAVQPCQDKGTPLCGNWKSDTIHFRRPTASSIFLKPIAFPGKTLQAKYVYADYEGRPEGATKIQWYRDDSPIAGATTSTYKVLASDTGHYLSFSVTPVALGKYTTVGKMVKSEEVLAHGTTMIDAKTGHEYPIVTIGVQTWMAADLRTQDTTTCDTTCWRFGTPTTWTKAVAYTGTAATYDENNRRGVCPTGWHIPTNNEWDALSSTVRTLASLSESPDSSGYYLKARKRWVHPGNDYFRFNATPNGIVTGGSALTGFWWSASQSVSEDMSIPNYTKLLDANTAFTRSTGNATVLVRCVKDY